MKQNEHILQSFNHEGVTISLRKDGIVHIYVEEGANVDFELQKNVIRAIIALRGDQPKVPVILETGDFVSLSDKAEMHTSMPFKENVLCIVFYTKNTADRIVANYYTKRFKTSSPFVLFSDFNKAVDYCLQRKQEQEDELNNQTS